MLNKKIYPTLRNMSLKKIFCIMHHPRSLVLYTTAVMVKLSGVSNGVMRSSAGGLMELQT